MRLPRILIVDELPQWIIESKSAAYHPFSNTIYIRRRESWRHMAILLLHELIHWLLHGLGFRDHSLYERIWDRLVRNPT